MVSVATGSSSSDESATGFLHGFSLSGSQASMVTYDLVHTVLHTTCWY